MNINFNNLEDLEELEDLESSENAETDVCPSCGTLLVNGNLNTSCNDPSGCGFFAECESGEDDEEEELLEELNFDD